ncbi:MAG: SDR family oxidoreductase [Fluviicoccus sp.]|uniref:SDR family oxidoreductase n=1 Tax=Fluviicoccus sp. TaxID=2003552 RepID=UPI0027247592|nr:SDR family oxidoreductase [Fluviicoccus sp.]MDO8330915.1 SDR family oxidoreductase [Fluviicoccus sp.]
MATVLVTGASGYIGRFLVKELLEKGETVFVLLRRPAVQLPELQAWLEAHGVAGGAVQAVAGDLSRPGAGVDEAGWQAMAAVTVIFHSGALFGWSLPEAEVRAVNVVGAVSLLETAAAKLSLQRFIQVSGYMLTISGHLAALGIQGDGSAADWPAIYRRTGSYEASKLEGHFAVKRAAARLGVPLTVIHPATLAGHAGTGELPASQEVARSLEYLLAGRLPVVPGGGKYRLPLVSMDYLAAFMARVMDYPEAAGREYLLADAGTPDLKTVMTLYARAAGVRAPLLALPVPCLRQLARWSWLSARTGLTVEKLDFLRQEPLETIETERMAQQMGLRQPALERVVEAVIRNRRLAG